MVFRTVRPQVDLSTCMKVPDGGEAALLIARMSPSCGSYTSSSARVGSPGRVDTSLIVWPVMKLMHSRRLGASVTNSQGKGASAVVTPLGPAQSLAPGEGGTHALNPANGANGPVGAICFRNFPVRASTTSTTLLERSARKYSCLSWSTQLISKEYIAPAVLLLAVTGTGVVPSSLTAPRSASPSLPPWSLPPWSPPPAIAGFPTDSRPSTTAPKTAYQAYVLWISRKH